MGNSTSKSLETQIGKDLNENDKLFGFVNKANICYANSITQCLYNSKKFKKSILSVPQSLLSNENSMIFAITELFKRIDTQKNRFGVLDTKPYMIQVKKNNDEFNNEYHHDAHEFLIWLLDSLHEYVKKEDPKTPITFISDLFEGKQASIIKCLNCENVTKRTETFLHLSVDVEQNCSLSHCLKKYIDKELLKKSNKFYCEVCNSYMEAEKQVVLKELPKILVIQLKRFKSTQYGLKKLTYCINVPYELRMDNLLERQGNDISIENSHLYSLYAITVHVGAGNEYGHYYCMLKISEKWFKFDDEDIKPISKQYISELFGNPDEDLEQSSSHCAYVLFYEQVDKNKTPS